MSLNETILLKIFNFIELHFQTTNMEANQVKLLKDLSKKIQSEKKNRVEIIAFLQSAKILNKKEKFTRQYSHLHKVFPNSK